MKKISVLLVFFFFMNCNKEDDTDNSQKLQGNWELRKIEYGYPVQTIIKYLPDNGNAISFSGSDKYIRTDITGSNDTLTSSGSYRITHSSTCDGKAVPVIHFSGDYNSTSLLFVAGDSLYFTSDSCVVTDGFERTYVKVK